MRMNTIRYYYATYVWIDLDSSMLPSKITVLTVASRRSTYNCVYVESKGIWQEDQYNILKTVYQIKEKYTDLVDYNIIAISFS